MLGLRPHFPLLGGGSVPSSSPYYPRLLSVCTSNSGFKPVDLMLLLS